MKEVKRGPANRCSGANCPKNPEEERAEAVKTALKKAAEETARKRAEALVNNLLRLSKGSLIKLLPVILRRVVTRDYPSLVLEVLLERIRRNQWDKLSPEDQFLVIQTEDSLRKRKG